MHDLQRIESCTLWQSFSNLKESMYNDQRKTFIQHVSDAKSSSGWSACTIGTERVVLCDSLLYLQRMFQDTSYVCKPAASQVWYTKADSYAACFQRPARAVVGLHARALDGLHAQVSDWIVLATVSADSQNPQDSWRALQARLRIRPFILSCRDTLKAETQAVCFKRWWQLCMICKELRIVLCDSHFPIWRSPCTTIKGRHSYSMFQMQRAALDGLHAQ